MLLIDSNYFYHCSKQLGQIDILKLIEYLDVSGFKDATKKRVYVTVETDNPKLKSFQYWLKSFDGPKLEVVTNSFKHKDFKCDHCGAHNRQLMENGVDLAIGTRLLEFALDPDFSDDKTLIFVSGDGDFQEQLKIVKKKKKNIILVGILNTISTDLQYLADDIIKLDEIKGLNK